ncbi:MAG: response regulator transcription factor [Phocaeicola sp.]
MNRIYILADNQDITRLGIQQLLGDAPSLVVADCNSLTAQLRITPDAIVIVDYALFNFESLAQMLHLKFSAPNSSWLLFSEELTPAFIRQLTLHDSNISLVLKSDSEAHIHCALQQVSQGMVYLCELAQDIATAGVIQPTPKELLTPAERKTLQQIALGRSTKEIAANMHLSFHTVNTHRKNIFRKIEVSNVQEAIKYAVCSGLIDYTDYAI